MPTRRILALANAKQPAYESKMEEGSAVSINGLGTVRIVPYQHWNSLWAWWCIRHDHLSGQIPHFVIAKVNHYNLEAGERLCCWSTSADTDTWNTY
jgi:hypothetical protein